MPNTTSSANMLLPIPVVGVDPGPQYASDLNSCLTLIDQHDHTPGSGVPITPSGLNISSDLSFGGNNATTIRSVRLSPQGSPLAGGSDLGCLYESGVDLYYNDGNGNHVRITQSGGVAGSPGSIANLSSPASASYVSANQTFVWQSAASTPANLDAASVILRNLTASSKGVTLSPPNALAADYSLTLPAVPASAKFVSLDASGNFGATWDVDSSTLEINSNVLQVKALGIGTAQLADGSVTQAKRAALGQQLSASSGGFNTSTLTPVDVTNLTVTITTTGRPVFIGVISDGSGSLSTCGSRAGAQTTFDSSIVRGSTSIADYRFAGINTPPTHIQTIDAPAAGTYTYKIQVTGTNIELLNSKLIAYEL